MKKIIPAFVLIFVVFASFSQSISNDQQLIRTTGFAIHSAHKAVLSYGVYTGNLAKSIEHQRYAIVQFNTGNKTEALYHSAYARNLAFMVIKANSMQINPSYLFTPEEILLINDSPTLDDLEKSIAKENLKDQDYLDPQLTGIDL